MAEIRTKLITDLPLAEVLGGFEIFPVNQFGVAKKTSTLDVINYTKEQDYATWVYRASSNLATNDISAKYIKLYNNPVSDGLNPEFFIGKAGYFSNNTGEVSGLSGFQFYFNEPNDRFVFVSYASSISGNRNLTAYYLDQNAYMYITNLSTSNTLSARNIYVTDQITISANSNTDALYIVQSGQGNAIEVFDEINDITPFVVTASGNVGIKTPSPVIDLTIAGSVSASQTLSARNINVLDRVGIATSSPNETLTVAGNISARDVIFDGRLNSNRWFETYTNYSAASANEARVATFVNSNSSNIVNVNTKVNSTSANWDSVYSDWNANSAFDLRARTYVGSNSANFSNSITTYNTISGTYAPFVYVNQGFLPLSGGEISSGVVRISGNTTFGSDVTIVGRLCAHTLTVINTESIPITASTLNVDGSGRFNGRFEVGGVANFDNNLFVSGFANVTGNVLSNGTITSRQFLQDLSSNSKEWGSVYNRWNNVSALDLDVRTFTNANSSNIRNVNTTVNTTSANWNSVYSNWNSNSASSLEAETFVQSNSSNIRNVNTTVNTTSAKWNSVYSEWNDVSSLDLNVRTFVNSNSSNIRNVNTTVNTTSAKWNSVYNSFFSLSGAIGEGLTEFQESSARYNRVSTRMEVTSANWNSVYSTFQANSAKYNSERGNLNIALSGTSLVSVPNHAVGFMDIYLNGIKLIAGQDFTETATTITLTEPTKYNDYKLEYIVYGAYNVANAVSKTGDTMSGELVVPSLVVNNSFSTPNIILDRQNTSLEGGQLTLRRASDNDDKYFIDVYGSGNNPDLRIFEKTGPSSFAVRATLQASTGNLGIGDATPSSRLTVYDNSVNPTVLIQQDGSGSALRITTTGSGDALLVEDTASDGTPFIVKSDGRVGVGVSSPSCKLDIQDTASGSQVITRTCNLATTNNSQARFDVVTGISNAYGILAVTNQALPYGELSFGEGVTGGLYISSASNSPVMLRQGGTERLRIHSNSNVGINTSNPNQALTVVGSISATGIIYGDGAGLKSIDLDRKFKQFREPRGLYTGGPTNWKMGSFLSETGKLYLTGYAYNNVTSFGTVGNAAYAYPNFVPAMLYGADSDIPSNETITKYYMGAREMFVYTDAGYLYGIGRNARGELGCGDQTQRSMWTRVSNLNNITDFSPPNACAGYYSGSTYYYNDPYGFCLAIQGGRLYQWGEGRSWNSGRGATMTVSDVGVSTSPTLVNVGAMQNKTNCVKCYAINDDYTSYGYGVVIDSNRNIFVTGSNFYGQLGLSDTVGRGQYVQVPTIKGDDIGSVMYNGYATTFVLDRQLNRLYASGYNAQGQLGINASTDYRTTFAQIPGLENNVKEVAIGGPHSAFGAAILLDGSVRTWGANYDGVLGHNGTTNTHVPTKPTNTGNTVFIKVKIAGAHLNLTNYTIYFLDNRGRIWSTGYNGHGQRGNGTFDSGGLINIMRTPPNVYFVDFDIGGFYSTAPSAAGGSFIHALDSDGNLWACGDNEYWQGGVGYPGQSLPTFRRCVIS